MNRTPGLGITISGFVLAVTGIVLRYAISVHSPVFNLVKIGDLCLGVGLGLALASLTVRFLGARTGQVARPEQARPEQQHSLLDPYAQERDEVLIP
jgi:hypothetical protein